MCAISKINNLGKNLHSAASKEEAKLAHFGIELKSYTITFKVMKI